MYYTLGAKNARRISNSLLLTIDGTEISAGFPALELLNLEKKRLFRLIDYIHTTVYVILLTEHYSYFSQALVIPL